MSARSSEHRAVEAGEIGLHLVDIDIDTHTRGATLSKDESTESEQMIV